MSDSGKLDDEIVRRLAYNYDEIADRAIGSQMKVRDFYDKKFATIR